MMAFAWRFLSCEAADLSCRVDRMGRPIPVSDAVVAVAALRRSASVPARDSDFQRVPGPHVLSLPPHLDA